MLKSLEIQASIRDLNAEIEEGVKQNIDMSAKAKELEELMASYDAAINAENKKKHKETEQMSVNETRKHFNAALKACLLGRPVAEADKEYMPQVVASGNFEGDANNSSYLIPEDYGPIYEKNVGIVSLAPLVEHVAVGTPTGKFPTIDYSQNVELADFDNDNDTELARKSAVFGQDTYALGTRGALIPVARELIQDAQTDVMAVVSQLFARAKVRTENADIIKTILVKEVKGAVKDINGDAISGAGAAVTCDMATVDTIDAIKTALLATIPMDYAADAKIVMPQALFAVLANLKDKQGRYYIQPDVTLGQKYAINGHEIVVVENRTMPAETIIVGNFKLIRELERVGYEVQSDASAGFAKNSILVRAIARFACKNMYTDGFVVLTKVVLAE